MENNTIACVGLRDDNGTIVIAIDGLSAYIGRILASLKPLDKMRALFAGHLLPLADTVPLLPATH